MSLFLKIAEYEERYIIGVRAAEVPAMLRWIAPGLERRVGADAWASRAVDGAAAIDAAPASY